MTFIRRGAISSAAVALATLAILLLPVAPVQAHKSASHDFESIPSGIEPPALGTGIEIEMVDYDSRVRLRNNSGKEVIVEGYDGEPYARLDPDGGVYLNSRSPAFYLNQDRNARTEVDPSADPSAPPEWERQADNGELTWYDKRTHTLKTGMPSDVKNPAEPAVIRKYGIPLRIGGQPAELKGTLFWSGHAEFPMGIVAGLLVATFLVAALGVFSIEAVRRAGPEG